MIPPISLSNTLQSIIEPKLARTILAYSQNSLCASGEFVTTTLNPLSQSNLPVDTLLINCSSNQSDGKGSLVTTSDIPTTPSPGSELSPGGRSGEVVTYVSSPMRSPYASIGNWTVSGLALILRELTELHHNNVVALGVDFTPV